MASDPQSKRLRLMIDSELDQPTADNARDAAGPDLAPHLGRDDLIDDDFDDDFDEEDIEPGPRRRVLPMVVAALVLISAGGGAWYAYTSGIGTAPPEELPLIRADIGPIKERPITPGGMEVPYQDKLVLNEISPDPAKPQVERLLPPPEVPKPPLPAIAQTPAPTTGAPGGVGSTLAPAGGPKAQQRANLPLPAPPEPETAETVAQQPPAAAPRAPAAKSAAAPAPVPTQTAALGGFVVQLASLKDRNGIGAEWVRLQKAFPLWLGDKTLAVQTVDLGNRGVYHRIRAGFFKDQASAAAMCAQLKSKQQDCIVAKR